MNGKDIVSDYYTRGWRFVLWPGTGDEKGPTSKDWTTRQFNPKEFHEGMRVGLLTGYPIAEGKILHDVDLDWVDGSRIALYILPGTDFVFGRPSKKVSHCFYTCPDAIPTIRYEDVDGSTLIELRGSKNDGEIGFQTMAPPSIWSKNGASEQLAFVKYGEPGHATCEELKRRVLVVAVAMILAKHLGYNGFGHGPRLAWAGFLLRIGFTIEELILMGDAISQHCNNIEVMDVATVVRTTSLQIEKGKKTVGGPTLIKHLTGDGKAVIQQINKWLGRDSDFVRTKDGSVIKDHQGNIRRAISLKGIELSFDEFSMRPLVGENTLLDDTFLTKMWLTIDEEYRFRPTYLFFEKVVMQTAHDNAFHPVKDYLSTLRWDGNERLKSWLIECAGAHRNAYVEEVSQIVLIAAVRRIKQPGCKFDELMVLEGEQGLNKSSGLRALCPKGEWFSDDLPLNVSSQKIIEGTLGKWIIEAADLAGKRKAEVEQLKATLSRQVDGPARLAYARLPVERARQFITVGTTNSAAYLTDPTGSRRFWPIKVKWFNVPRILDMRDQLWAEAAYLESRGASIRLAEDLWPEATKEQERRREIDPWESKIREACLMVIPSPSDSKRRIAMDDIWDTLSIETVRRDRHGALRIAEIMQRLGFKRATVRTANSEMRNGFVTEYPDKLDLPEDEESGEASDRGVVPF